MIKNSSSFMFHKGLFLEMCRLNLFFCTICSLFALLESAFKLSENFCVLFIPCVVEQTGNSWFVLPGAKAMKQICQSVCHKQEHLVTPDCSHIQRKQFSPCGCLLIFFRSSDLIYFRKLHGTIHFEGHFSFESSGLNSKIQIH